MRSNETTGNKKKKEKCVFSHISIKNRWTDNLRNDSNTISKSLPSDNTDSERQTGREIRRRTGRGTERQAARSRTSAGHLHENTKSGG